MEVSRRSASDLREAEVIDSSRRIRTSGGIVSPHDHDIVCTRRNRNLRRSEGSPRGTEVHSHTSIQSDASGRQGCCTNTRRQRRTRNQLNVSRYECYTQVVVKGRRSFTITQPVIGEYVVAGSEVKCLLRKYNTSSAVRIGVRCTTVVRDIERVRAFTVVSSRTDYPSIDEIAVIE